MIDRADAEATIYRVAICAFTYYADKLADEPGYSVDEDVHWCAAPLTGLPEPQLTALRDTVRVLITDPTADRQSFIRQLHVLAGE